MAKVYKATIYLTDHSEEIQGIDGVKEALENLGYELWVGIDIADVKESKSFDWDDDLKINSTDSTNEDFEAYFKD